MLRAFTMLSMLYFDRNFFFTLYNIIFACTFLFFAFFFSGNIKTRRQHYLFALPASLFLSHSLFTSIISRMWNEKRTNKTRLEGEKRCPIVYCCKVPPDYQIDTHTSTQVQSVQKAWMIFANSDFHNIIYNYIKWGLLNSLIPHSSHYLISSWHFPQTRPDLA